MDQCNPGGLIYHGPMFFSAKSPEYLRMKAGQFRQLASEHGADPVASTLLELAADLEALAAEAEQARSAP